MKVCIYVDDYYMDDFVNELLHEGMYICWWTMIWNAYVELTWWLYDVVIVVDVVRCCCRQVVNVVRCCRLSCWVHAYSYKVGGSCPVEC